MLHFNGKDIDMKSRDSSLKVFSGSGTMAAWMPGCLDAWMPLNARISWPLFPWDGDGSFWAWLLGSASSCVSGTNPAWEH